MGRLYYIPFSGSFTTTADLVELTPADDKPVRARGFLVGQKTEIAEAQEEVLDVRLMRMTATVTSGSGGGSATVVQTDTADTAIGATIEVSNTTIATTSGSTHELRFPCQVRNTPYEFWFPDGPFGPKVKGTEYMFLRLAAAPADSIDIYGWLCVEEE